MIIKEIVKKISRLMPDNLYIVIKYFIKTKKIPNLRNPSSINEKLQWLKLHDRKAEYTIMVDKYLVKEYIENKIGSEYIIPTLAVWDSADKIDINLLPDKFVLKCNHDSHSILICRDKQNFDLKSAKIELGKRMANNGFWYAREWPYKNVQPKIIAEQYLENQDKSPLVDYKFYCFGGKPRYFMYSLGEAEHDVRNHKFDMNLNSIDYVFKKVPTISADEITLPKNVDKMIEIVETLCIDMQHVRIDLYNIDSQIYFGEITFYSGAGFIDIDSKEYSEYIENLIDLKKI